MSSEAAEDRLRQTEKTIGIVLRAVDFSETSRIVTFFTRDLGKLGAIAKGRRRLKGAFEVSLDVLSICRICVIRKPTAELDLLTEARLEERFVGLARDLPALYAGYFLAEILDGLTQPHDPHPALFDLTANALRRLAEGRDRLTTVGRPMARLLVELGYAPNLDACAGCSAPLADAERQAIGVQPGGLLCVDCRRTFVGWLSVHSATVAALRILMSEDPTAAEETTVAPALRGELWRVLWMHIQPLLSRQSKLAPMLRF